MITIRPEAVPRGGRAQGSPREHLHNDHGFPVALALGSGGLRGMAHIGVLKVLVENGIRPAAMAGTSSGSIIAALYASGMEPDEIERLALSAKTSDIYDCALNPFSGLQMAAKIAYDYLHVPMFSPPQAPMGLLRGNRLEKVIAAKTGNKTFAETRIPLAITAVDINTGKLVVFCDERNIYPDPTGKTVFMTGATLAEAVRASTAIPGVFEPKRIAGRMLVDGGVKDNVPADILRRMGMSPIVAVDLGLADQRPVDIDDIVEVIQQAIDIMGRELTDTALRRSGAIVIAPKTGDVGLADMEKIPVLIKRGAEAARVVLRRVVEASR